MAHNTRTLDSLTNKVASGGTLDLAAVLSHVDSLLPPGGGENGGGGAVTGYLHAGPNIYMRGPLLRVLYITPTP